MLIIGDQSRDFFGVDCFGGRAKDSIGRTLLVTCEFFRHGFLVRSGLVLELGYVVEQLVDSLLG